MPERNTEERSRIRVEVRDPDSVPAASTGELAYDEEYEELTHERVFALFSGTKRTGPWEPADRIEASSAFGSIELDFRHAALPPSGIVEIRANAVFGSIRITVPDGADVEIKGFPLFGSFDRQYRKRSAGEAVRDWVRGERREDEELDEEPPLFQVTGTAVFGSVVVRSR